MCSLKFCVKKSFYYLADYIKYCESILGRHNFVNNPSSYICYTLLTESWFYAFSSKWLGPSEEAEYLPSPSVNFKWTNKINDGFFALWLVFVLDRVTRPNSGKWRESCA